MTLGCGIPKQLSCKVMRKRISCRPSGNHKAGVYITRECFRRICALQSTQDLRQREQKVPLVLSSNFQSPVIFPSSRHVEWIHYGKRHAREMGAGGVGEKFTSIFRRNSILRRVNCARRKVYHHFYWKITGLIGWDISS